MAEDSDVLFILDALACGAEVTMDFKQVATVHGISRSDHASTKFQNKLKKYGYKYERKEKRLVKLEESGATTPTKKATTNGQKGGGKTGSTKKRKLEETEDAEEAEPAGAPGDASE